ncbi:hypothetical protein GGR53DRAFT_533186 [Hypoxylon sp. FL1150]|nr:hypothetical protein GGR53DRAFT_533186 [Hypoxylon sp. FL1150]
MASSQDEGDKAPNLPGTSSSSDGKFLQKRVASRAPLFNDLDEAFRKIAARSKPSDNSSEKESEPNPHQSQEEDSPTSQDVILRKTSPYAAGRSLTEKYTTPTKQATPAAAMSTAEGQLGKVDQAPMVDVPLNGPSDTGSKIARQHQHPSEPPQASLPDVPKVHRQESKTVDVQENTPTDSTVSNSQHLLNVVNDNRHSKHPFLPSPLKFPLKSVHKSNEDHQSESSSADNTTESNLDPFRYDSQRYQAFVHSGNERDVSRALKRLSNVGEASEVTLFTPEGSPSKAPGKKLDEQHGEPRPGVFGKRIRDLRVQIGLKPELEPEGAGGQGRLTRSKAHLRLDKLVRDSTGEGGDWVTEATSEAGFANSPIVKLTGSSVVDFSDDEKENEKLPSLFKTSRHPVLHHPSSKTAQPESYELKDLKSTKQQVMLPKHKYSVFPMNSERLFSSNSDTNQSIARTLSNPFTKNAYRKADNNGNFMNSIAKGASKYEFRDSVSEYAQHSQLGQSSPQDSMFDHNADNGVSGKHLKDGEQTNAEGLGSERQTLGSSRDVEVTPRKVYEPRLVDQMYPGRQKCGNIWRLEQQQKDSSDFANFGRGSYIGEPLSTRSKFEFELLPLEEAQRKQKEQRESGDGDETLPSAVRYQKAKSNSFAGSSPITVPPPTVSRQLGPNLSTDFSYQSWTSLRDAFQDTPSPFSATGQNQTPQSSSATRSLLRHHGSPVTPSSDISSTPTRQFFGRFRPRRLLSSPQRDQRRRLASDQPTLNHNPLPHLESGLSLAAMEAVMEASVSEDARRRRAHWFYLMATLSILFPFFAILVLTGMLTESLVWYTKGEVRQLTIKQRNFIRGAFLAESCLFVVLIAAIIAVFTKRA